jgi:hypothetical protein
MIDFGGETRIEHDEDAVLASNMKLDKDDDSLSPEVECDSNDIYDDRLSPQDVRVYLVDRGIQDRHIARNSISLIELEKNDCGSQSIEDCAIFDFDIPEEIPTKKYKIVVVMVFDEAEWIFINPVRILDKKIQNYGRISKLTSLIVMEPEPLFLIQKYDFASYRFLSTIQGSGELSKMSITL